MGIRQFFRAFHSTKGQARTPEPEDGLAADVRETMGPLAGGGGGGHMTGESVYHRIEDRHVGDHDIDHRSQDD